MPLPEKAKLDSLAQSQRAFLTCGKRRSGEIRRRVFSILEKTRIFIFMNISIGGWSKNYDSVALNELAALWNANASGRHGFFPWSGELLRQTWLKDNMAANSRLLEARLDDALVGFCHVTWMREYGYPAGGAVEALLVGAPYRNNGIGGALLNAGLAMLAAHAGSLQLIDAMGAWPYGFLYTTLADGSERSGVFSDQPGLKSLFRQAGFEDARKSMVMRALAPFRAPRTEPGRWTQVEKRRDATWLDRVFRMRELWGHNLYDRHGNLLSRAIYGFMENESRQEGKTIYSVFGVNTPAAMRGKGYAAYNIASLLHHVGSLGADIVELHVYNDNTPATALYRRTGFTPIADTMMMLRRM